MSATRPFAIVTGASTGIGFELAKRCSKEGYDLLIAADEPEIEKAAASLRTDDGKVEALEADLATIEGVDKLYAAARGRQVDALLANAGRGLGRAGIDRTDVRESMRRPHEISERLAGDRGVGRIAPEAAHQGIVLQARPIERAMFNGLCFHL